MRPKIHWIDLAAGVPGAGDWLEDEVAGWKAEGVDVVVSLLEAREVGELRLDREAGLCHDLDMEFILRRWLPRHIDIHRLSDEEIQDIVITATLTPRKCLGFKTPFQAILKELGKDAQIRFS